MMEFILVYGFIAMMMVVVVGNLSVVENYNRENTIGDIITVKEAVELNEMGVDLNKFKQM